RQNNFKVVLTGEGADEFLAGYNIFKEAKVRRFWAKQPDSKLRPLLLKRLYPYITSLSAGSGAYLRSFFREGLTDVAAPDYSHAIRWRNTGRARRFFSETIRRAAQNVPALDYPAKFNRWGDLQKAQYLEISAFLTPYLLSSQGDRMGMAHSVEGRFPFLDHRVIEFANKLPADFKLHRLNEKYILKKAAQSWLPPEIWRRVKRPYRAPIQRSFFSNNAPEYVQECLSPQKIEAAGLFKAAAVSHLLKKINRGLPLSETDEMALAGILSSQLVYSQFVANFETPPPVGAGDNVKTVNSE
ncbi:MAG TPA: asparagine synthase, partial [Anaerolineae bacterium]|nr:asparagine synthase [Anaerolineae bacterium]